MGGAVLAGLLDARDLVEALIGGGILEEGSDASSVCDLISAFSVSCEACSDGEEYRLSIHVDQIMAEETGSELVAQDECDPRRALKAATSSRRAANRSAGLRVGAFFCQSAVVPAL